MLGDGDRAFAYWLSVCPSTKQRQIERYRAEPYVYSQMTAGRDAPTAGEAKNSWLTGTAAWSLVAITQWILGIRPSPAGLVIDPCIPRQWRGYQVTRRFRGRIYRIEVRNPAGVCRGVRSLLVNGRRIEGNTVPLTLGGTGEVEVIAELG
jgi:cellobiose phosphorylase